eukprot:1936791-Rhodomonas_salina.1
MTRPPNRKGTKSARLRKTCHPGLWGWTRICKQISQPYPLAQKNSEQPLREFHPTPTRSSSALSTDCHRMHLPHAQSCEVPSATL